MSVRYRILPHRRALPGILRVAVQGREEVLHFTQKEVARGAIALHYRGPGTRYAETRYESPLSILAMYPDAMKSIFDLTDDGYEHVCEKARAMQELRL